MAKKEKTEREAKIEEILLWIIENSSDEEAMDKISTLVFPYTTKYKKIYP